MLTAWIRRQLRVLRGHAAMLRIAKADYIAEVIPTGADQQVERGSLPTTAQPQPMTRPDA